MTNEAQKFYRLFIQTSVVNFYVKSVDGYDSFMTFTNDYSHYGYIYPIKERKDVLDKFKILKIEIVRSDRGEYYGRHTLKEWHSSLIFYTGRTLAE